MQIQLISHQTRRHLYPSCSLEVSIFSASPSNQWKASIPSIFHKSIIHTVNAKFKSFNQINQIYRTSGCNSTQSAKSASAANSSVFRGLNLTATLTLPETTRDNKNTFHIEINKIILI